ncbi:hypothetical protein AAJ76_1090003417 [Vairimorpha ceranae]|uniref:Thioredoxin-like fold domain-containing protein n=1 Tax=Vairimorpha ceranae TaxID=40302 RepID=A0A0F9YN59_9MICR|nr:hypothetical protein AAJ76_1090003417 [Vairimorpha ceranae]KAF5141460.1 hypothetical protein G9O61_00g003230 [Vairimorpha ceranae]KKO74157.1 hypothetical protein AAJ76_1090003417 [Vairimorpha ceranae]
MFTRKSDCTTFDKVKSYVEKLNEDVLLIFGSTKCPPCRELSRFLDNYNTEKEFVIIDLKKPDFKDMDICREKYGLTAFPTYIVVDKDMNKKIMEIGYKGEEYFEKFINTHFK